MVSEASSAFSFPKARCWVSPQSQVVPFLSRSHRGWCHFSDMLTEFHNLLTMPKNRLRSERSLGWGMSTMALTLAGSFLTPSLSVIWPRYSNLVWENIHLSGLMVRTLSDVRVKVLWRRWSCSAWFLPLIRMSSTWQVTPSRWPSSLSICFRKTSGAEEMPYGRQRNMNQPNGVMNVVSFALSALRAVWWNPELASNLE